VLQARHLIFLLPFGRDAVSFDQRHSVGNLSLPDLAIKDKNMPFAFLMTDYMKRLEAGEPRAVALRDGTVKLWRRIVPYLITHRSKEWWEVGCH